MRNTLPQKWFDDRVEAFVDNSLNARETALFEAQLAEDTALQREVARARTLQRQLAVIGARCPDVVVQGIADKIENASMPKRKPSAPVWWSMAAGIGFAALLLLPGGDSTPSQQKIEQAQAELRLALGILNTATERARSTTEQAINNTGVRDALFQHLKPLVGDQS